MISLQNMVGISEFRQNINLWLSKVKGQIPVIILQNNKPKVALIDLEYLEYLEKYASGYYDKGDAAEAKRIMKTSKKDDFIPFKPENYLD